MPPVIFYSKNGESQLESGKQLHPQSLSSIPLSANLKGRRERRKGSKCRRRSSANHPRAWHINLHKFLLSHKIFCSPNVNCWNCTGHLDARLLGVYIHPRRKQWQAIFTLLLRNLWIRNQRQFTCMISKQLIYNIFRQVILKRPYDFKMLLHFYLFFIIKNFKKYIFLYYTELV